LYQWDIFSNSIYPRKGISPTDEEITSIVQLAHSAGAKVMLRPLVDPDWSNPNTKGTWRGRIGLNFTEADWIVWFDSYSKLIIKYATLATTLKADEYSVGGELTIASHQEAHWRKLIANVRKVYKGAILYGANHGNEASIQWWDAVDYIGIDAYYRIAPSKPQPSLQDLLDAWVPIKNQLEILSKQYKRPVIFSEIGYCSKTGANVNPAACEGSILNLTAQEILYESFYQTFWPMNWFEGVFWWAWNTDPNDGGIKDQGFTPNGKLAERVMAKWNL